MSTTDAEHRTCKCPAEPDVHCHACTKHERDERLRDARELVQEARVSGFTQIDSETVFQIDAEVTRQAAVIQAVREAIDGHKPNAVTTPLVQALRRALGPILEEVARRA